MSEVVISGARDASTEATATPSNVAYAPIDSEDTTTDMSDPSPEQTTQQDQPEGNGDTPPQNEGGSAFVVGGVDVSAFAEEYERNGQLSDESYTALEERGFSHEMVDAYIRGLQQQTEKEGELAQKYVDAILQEVGGEERYNRVMAWAADHLTQEEQDVYDEAVTSSKPAIARLAVLGLIHRYEQEKGHPPKLVSGQRAPETSPGFKNRSELIAAMSDKRYGSDPEYTRDVERRVRVSGLMRSGRA